MSAVSMRGATGLPAPADRLVTLPEFPHGKIPTLGYGVIDWVERNLVQPNGPDAGRPFRYQPDQVNFMLWAYALDRDARWLFNHLVRRLAKGSGKSPFAAAYALAEFLGPVRLERFDDRELGGCIGRPVSMPWVQIAATAESQTTNTMRFVRAFCPKGGRLAREYDIDVGKTQFYRQPEGTLEVITSSYTAAEGAQTTAAIGDETEHWLPTHQGPELMATLADNLAKTGGRLMETANSWKPGYGSVAEATWDDWVAQEEGRLQGEQRILYDARAAPADTDMSSGESLRAALEHVYAFCPWVDIDTIVGRIWRASSKPDDSKRKYLNRPTAPEDAWCEPEDFALLADPHEALAEGDEIVLFFDGSKSRDATALTACRMDDGVVFPLGVWERPEGADEGWTVDVADVDRVVAEAFKTFEPVAFFADVREFESFALTAWPKAYADRLLVMAQPNGRPAQWIAWDMRGHGYEFARATETCLTEILDGEFRHAAASDSKQHQQAYSALGRHVANCRRKAYRDMVAVGKESPKSAKKIDAAVTMIGARMLRRLVLASPEWKKRERRKNRKKGHVHVVM